jgi:hypothetical protein
MAPELKTLGTLLKGARSEKSSAVLETQGAGAASFLPRRLGPPGVLRVAPIDPFKKAGRLGSRQRNDPIVGGRPNETAAIQALCIKREPDAVIPEALDQRS